MLSRYSMPEMTAIWSDDARLERWREVELAVVGARVALGLSPIAVLDAARAVPAPTPEAVAAVEEEVGHDVVAFLYAWTEGMDADVAGHVHRDLTSSDVVDSAQALALSAATKSSTTLPSALSLRWPTGRFCSGTPCVWAAPTGRRRRLTSSDTVLPTSPTQQTGP